MASAQAPTATDTDTTAAETKTQTELTESFQHEPASALPEAITEAPAAAEPTEAGAPTVDEKDKELQAKWPGWPGCIVFRIVVPVLKVGGIIGRKGDLIKKLVEETRARVRILDGPVSSPDRIVIKIFPGSYYMLIYMHGYVHIYDWIAIFYFNCLQFINLMM